MLKERLIDFSNVKLSLYNIFKYIGKPSSELEQILAGGIQEASNNLFWIKGFFTEEQEIFTINGIERKLRYDFAVCDKIENNRQNICIRIEGNGSQHFWRSFDQTPEEFLDQQINFFVKQIKSKVPIVNINMCITGEGSDRNVKRREAYIQLIESGVFEQALYTARLQHKTININLLDKDNQCLFERTACGRTQVDNYIDNMLRYPDFKVFV